MKLLLPTLTLLSSLTVTLAQGGSKSTPFNLIVTSSDPTLNGTYLTACSLSTLTPIHAICVPGTGNVPTTEITPFFFNITSTSDPTEFDGNGTGYLTFDAPSTPRYPAQNLLVRLQYDMGTNVALARLDPISFGGLATQIDFLEPYFYGRWSVNDLVTPPVVVLGGSNGQQWYICEDTERRQVLNWVVGQFDEPQNPSCVEVSVGREFI